MIVTALQVVLKCSTPIPAAAGVGVLSFGVRGQVVSASNRHPLLASTSTTLLKMRRDHILRTAIHSGEQPVREAVRSELVPWALGFDRGEFEFSTDD